MTRASAALALTAGTVMCAFVPSAKAAPEGIHKIQHVVMIMQENHSFDSYFGTYPGANGIPAGVCVPDPAAGVCVRPFHDSNDEVVGGPHGTSAAIEDIDGGRMDGFVGAADGKYGCAETGGCGKCKGGGDCALEVMGYQDAREVPNYWTYAQKFVLQDDMFESAASWSLPEHLFLVSGWSARCPKEDANPLDCVNTLVPVPPSKSWSAPVEQPPRATYAWTDITHLMAAAGVSWRYYVAEGNEPDCEDDEAVTCKPVKQNSRTPGIWNELPDFTDVKQDGQLGNIQSLNSLYGAAHEAAPCALPNVSWVVPSLKVSEHPPSKISAGQTYVTTLINTIMRSPCWGSTAIFLSWDDWGGFYDHVKPPTIDENGYGLRVPGLVISPYAKTGYVDHQQLSHDAYLKFIEDDFLNGQRLNPATDGRPDPRPDVREEAPGLGDLANDFDFEQPPRPPLLLSAHPLPGPASEPPGGGSQPPTVSNGPPSLLTSSSATLHGIVSPNGATVSDCHFEYGTSVFYEASIPCSPMPEGGEALDEMSASITGLSADMGYHFRIVATNEHGTTTSPDLGFMTLPDPPTVTSVTPTAGLERGGAIVTITGTNLARVSSVHFGSAAATSVAVSSNTSLTAVAPRGAQTVDVTVMTPGGRSNTNAGDRFLYVPTGPRPTITSISPSSGPAGGGTTVTIAGTGFNGVTGLHFGPLGVGGLTVDSPTSISVPSPASTAETAHVTVTTPNGTSSETGHDQFRAGPPTVTNVSPGTGSTAGGTSVTVTGSGFAIGAGVTVLRFGSVAGTSVECVAITTCTAVSPPHKAGNADVRTSVNGQTSLREPSTDRFTYK